jgi:hypothetical protein
VLPRLARGRRLTDNVVAGRRRLIDGGVEARQVAEMKTWHGLGGILSARARGLWGAGASWRHDRGANW